MEVLTVSVLLAFTGLLVIPALLFLCLDKKESLEPKLTSHKTTSKKSEENSSRKKRTSDSKDVTVIVNGNTVAANKEEMPRSSTHIHDAEGQPVKDNSEALTNGDSVTPRASVVNETSPANSQRSSRASGGQSRLSSQDRALPDIPHEQNARLSTSSERSPSAKRALPNLPAGTSVSHPPVINDSAHLYDQLERDLPSHQIRAKNASVKTTQQCVIDEEGSASSIGLIEPDEITRTSLFTSADPNEVYSQTVHKEEPEAKKPANLKVLDSSKSKAMAPYSTVKKDGASSQSKSPTTEATKVLGDNGEPDYQEAPPVPAKGYNLEEEFASSGCAAAADTNAQGSGFHGQPSPNMGGAAMLDGVSESYEVLSGRESIEIVLARRKNLTEEGDYDSVDEKPGVGGSSSKTEDDGSGAMELYAEIDMVEPSPPPVAATGRPSIKRSASPKEELYAEIDLPPANVPKSQGSTNGIDPYEKVSDPGEPMDSAGYAIVKEQMSAVAANNPPNDEEDYAECDPIPGNARQPPAAAHQHPSRHASDISDYATVSYEQDSLPPPQPEQQPLPEVEERPFQRYTRREHVYQEIDEVGNKSPPPNNNDS